MADYDNRDKGVLFKHSSDNEKAPNYKGSINVGGTEYWLSAWIKEGAKGKFMSLSVQPKDQQKPAPRKTGNAVADMQDDVPW